MFNGSEESYIILQNTLLTGISDISFKSAPKQRIVRLLGSDEITRKTNQPSETTCSFSKPYNGADFIQDLTGSTELSGQFIYGENAIDFTKAAISNYSLNLDEEGLGQISVEMKIYGKMTPTTNLRLSEAARDFEVLNQTPKMQLFNLNDTASAVKSINFSSSFQLQRADGIGTIGEPDVKIMAPVKHEISANIEMLEQEVEDVTGLFEVDNLTNNILAIFAPDENLSNVNRILEIQSKLDSIKSSGIYIDDLDFSLGSCSYNHFQFPESSLSSQDLKSKAGEVVQLGKNYSAYSTVIAPRVVFNEPAEIPNCDDHLAQIESNLNIASTRLFESFFRNQVDFEDRPIGETDLNLAFYEASVRIAKTGEDFELIDVGPYVTNMYKPASKFLDKVDFEGFPDGSTIELALGPNFFNQRDFEGSTAGSTVDLDQLKIDNFLNKLDFEELAAGSTLDLAKLEIFSNQPDFEGFAAGSTIDLTQLTIDNFFNQSGFEGLATDSTVELDQLEIFSNQVDFESLSQGEIDTNLNNL